MLEGIRINWRYLVLLKIRWDSEGGRILLYETGYRHGFGKGWNVRKVYLTTLIEGLMLIIDIYLFA